MSYINNAGGRGLGYALMPLPEDPSQYYPPFYAWVFQVVTFPQVSPAKPCTHLSPIRAACPAYLNLLGFITRTIFGEQCRSLSSSLCSFLHSPVTSSQFGRNILRKHYQPALLPQCERPCFTPIQNNGQNYSSVYLNLYIFGQQTGRQNILLLMTADNPLPQSVLNFFVSKILIR